jgi:hypothetical protein
VGVFVLFVLGACAASGRIIYVEPGQAVASAILIDHNCVDLSVIPDAYLPKAAALRMLTRHASVGDGINWGLDCLAGSKPTQSVCSSFPPGKYDRSNWHLENRGNPGWKAKVDDLVAQTASRASDFDVFTMKFCYIDALGNNRPDWEYFRSRMEQLEADYPDKKFVWWTIPLTRDGQAGTDLFNAQVRSYCAANGKILFDIADIECHEPNGVKLTNAAGNEVISQNYTREIHAGHLNPEGRVRVVSALWHLMARLAGWQQPGTIQGAIDLASDSDIIIVADGVYTGPGNHDIDFNYKSVTVRSENGPEATIIDCQGEGYGFYIVGNRSGPARIEGFTIRHASLGAIRCYGSILVRAVSADAPQGSQLRVADYPFGYAPVIVNNCRIVENPDGGILIDSHDNVTITNCYIAANGTAGIYAYASAPIIRTCVVVQNYDSGIRAIRGGDISNCTVADNNGIGIWISQGAILNSIVWGNGQRQLYNPDDNASVTYCDVQSIWPGQGNLDTDPLFADPNSGDYHLNSQAGRWDPDSASWVKDDVTSLCIDAGEPMSPIEHEPFPNGGRINMGAYGGTAEASKSYFGEPVCEVIIAGDINGDCIIDFKDFTLMALHWLECIGPNQGGWCLVEDDTEDSYSCEGNFDIFYPCSNAADEDWDTYALPA